MEIKFDESNKIDMKQKNILELNKIYLQSYEKERFWRGLFGIDVQVIDIIFTKINKKNIVKEIHLLWTLNFYKKYETEIFMELTWKTTRKTIRKHVWEVTDVLYDVLSSTKAVNYFSF